MRGMEVVKRTDSGAWLDGLGKEKSKVTPNSQAWVPAWRVALVTSTSREIQEEVEVLERKVRSVVTIL